LRPLWRNLPLVLALCGGAVWAQPGADAGLRRFAVIAGNDEGGPGTRPLLYAREDAKKLHGILTRLGGVRPKDAQLLLNQDAEAFLAALTEAERRLEQARREGERTALYVYYSGHAQDGALRLGRTRLPFEALAQRLSAAPADVKVGIFDACQSGALTRRKGVRRAPAFEIQADGGKEARGMVLLTSSAADEDSQESDLIGGSYFSHHLASGLLGDADRSGDGRVTLSEAYAYAYERTVADTAASAAGAQHPTFSYDFQGNGDWVLTELLDGREGLVFPASATSGPWFVVDARGAVVAEVWTTQAQQRRIAVAPGTYKLKRRLPDRLRVGQFQVHRGRLTHVTEQSLRDAPFSDDPVKGARGLSAGTSLGVALSGSYQSFFDGPGRRELFPSAPLFGVEANLAGYLRPDWVLGFDLGLGASRAALALGGTQVPYQFSELTLGTSLLVGFPTGRWTPVVGTRMALIVLGRQFDDPLLPAQAFSTVSPGLVGGLGFRLTPRLSAGVRGRLHYLHYNVDENRSLGYWELAASLGYELKVTP
jgi:hypothetical protein